MKRNYDDEVYKRWRAEVYKRDGRRCQMPNGSKCCGKKRSLQAHHIQKWSTAAALRFDTRNGITLCWDCHNSIKGKEHLYESLFMETARRNGNN